ncbi:error-prone DNA polymerase [Mitsuaria sp. WAJ17]|nr:error-prone DNA polymerase [Mitsuaria sp. WAJ17]
MSAPRNTQMGAQAGQAEQKKQEEQAGRAADILASTTTAGGLPPAPGENPGPGFQLLLLARHREGYGQLSEFITRLRRASPVKGRYRLDWPLLQETLAAGQLSGCLVLLLPDRRLEAPADLLEQARALQAACAPGQLWLGLCLLRELSDEAWLQLLREMGEHLALPLVACGDVHFHVRSRKPLQDVMTATRLNRPLHACGGALHPQAERHLRSRLRLSQIYPADTLAETLQIASLCHFSLDELRYQYPEEVVPAGYTAQSWLRKMTYAGMQRRWPQGVPPQHRQTIENELALICELGYEHYFLTVADIVRFARSRKILCQGRGSAANSLVCYSLYITSIGPERGNLLFGRFISRERNEPPDIDVDFEHERREEVIQYLYERYGRDRAALTAVVIRYRARSALRDVGRALGIEEVLVERLAKDHSGWSQEILPEDRLQTLQQEILERQGRDLVQELPLRQLIVLARQLMGMPRHLSQHVGGFVLTQGRLSRLVPIENATMPGRSVIEWDKDDLDALNLLKVDVLALGMLSALRRCFALVNGLREEYRERPLELACIPEGDEATYDMICRADTVGTFQIESRAQMSMLPRLQPRCFYDLVVEVAIVRPGPIEGGMVHPYLENRRKGKDGIRYPKEALKEALERTYGIPIFQEQVMQVAMIAAGFTPGEADQLRRAMAAWKRPGDLAQFHARILSGMRARGYADEFAEAIFRQIQGFASYGFPESHAASFALLTYASCWFKRHEPAAFLCALLNSQPLGFYTPAQLVQDAKRHGVEVRPADVNLSDWDCSLEIAPRAGELERSWMQGEAGPPAKDRALPFTHSRPQPAVRLGLRLVAGLGEEAGRRLVARREGRPQQTPPHAWTADSPAEASQAVGAHGAPGAHPAPPAPYRDAQDLALRARLDAREMQLLAAADALHSLAGHRRQQIWEASAQGRTPALLQDAPIHEPPLQLSLAPEGEELLWDYRSLGLSLRRHPLALLRGRLQDHGLRSSAQLAQVPNGRRVRTGGLVTVRQKPQTAKGTLFISLEDEHGSIQVIVWADVYARHRSTILAARLLAVQGRWQRSREGICNLLAESFEDLSPWLGRMADEAGSRDFR